MNEQAEAVLSFWLGTLGPDGCAEDSVRERWFKKSEAFDQEIRERFGEMYERAARGELDDWLTTPRGRLAYVIVLDQLSRNMFRGTAKMYSMDEKAVAAAARAVKEGDDKGLRFSERGFLYMPFMHSESLADQERCVALFSGHCDELAGDLLEKASVNLDYAEKHRAIVARFGRFPHRNEILGRASTEEEAAFLKEPGSGF